MPSFAIRAFALALLIGLPAWVSGTSPAAASPESETIEAGSIAPRHGWTTEGGCPARTSEAPATAAPSGPLELRWTAKLPGPVSGEPVVSGAIAYADCDGGKTTRILCAVAVSDGRLVSQRSFRTTQPLLPSVMSGLLVVRDEPELAAKMEKRLGEIAEIATGGLAARIAALPADAPRPVLYDQLRARLDEAPADAAATERVRSLLPAGVEPPHPFTPARWIDFIEAADYIPVKIVKAPPDRKPDMTIAERTVGIQTQRWRPDVVGVQSGDYLVVTSLKEPGAIARCLSLGDLVCRTLGGFFAGGTQKRDLRFPITVLLCETKDEYIRVSGGDPSQPSLLQYTAGHYSPNDEETRTFLPDEGEEKDFMLRVFAHEITHHWMDLRCPWARTIHEGPAPGRAQRVSFEPRALQGFTNPMLRLPSRKPLRRISSRTLCRGVDTARVAAKFRQILNLRRGVRGPHE